MTQERDRSYDIEAEFDPLTAFVVASLERQIEHNRRHGDYESKNEHSILNKLLAGVQLSEMLNVQEIVDRAFWPRWYEGSDPMHRRFCNLAAAAWKRFQAEHHLPTDADVADAPGDDEPEFESMVRENKALILEALESK